MEGKEAIMQNSGDQLKDQDAEMIQGLSEILNALERIASGDGSVRVPDDFGIMWRDEIARRVNLAAENLGEIVDLSHEFAMGLAEHFDVLKRVSKGDLDARVSGTSQMELLESLKDVTNHMIASVSKEISERKNAQQAARESEKRYSALFEATAEGILVADLETKKFSYANPAICHMLGYREEELTQMSVLDIHPEEELERIVSIFHAQGRGEMGLAPDMPCLRKDGTTIYVDINTAKVAIDGRDRNVGFFTDTTERKRAEDQLMHLNAVLRAMRTINYLITRETNCDRLLQGACEGLIETVGYHNAWIARVDESGNVTASANAGFDGGFAPMADRLKHGKLPHCARRALQQSQAVVTNEPSAAECADCPMASSYGDRAALSASLEYEKKVYGFIAVSVPHDFAGSSEALELFEQVARDIAFGLYRIELEIRERESVDIVRQSEQRLREIIQGSAIATFVIDKDHTVTHWNRACEKLTGVPAIDMIGTKRPWAALYAKEQPVMADLVVDGASAQDVECHYEDKCHESATVVGGYEGVDFFPVLGERGRWLFFTAAPLKDKGGKVTGAIETLKDVTDHKEAENALRESEEMFRSMSSSAQDAILMIDDKGNVSFWNDAAEKIFGYSREEVFGKNLHLLLAPQKYHEGHTKAFAEFQKSGQGSAVGKTLELIALKKGGTEFPVELSLSSVRQKGKWHAIGILRDITERKEVELSKQEAIEAAEAANQAKSEFLANMSHEIRTPMNAVIGMTDLALDTQLTTQQRECLEIVKTSSDSLLTLLNDILDLSKIESGKLQLDLVDFNLPDTVGDTLKTLAVRADEKGLELACRISPDVPEILNGDPGRLRQILINLVGNAIKFTERGEVVVHVEKKPERDGKIGLHFTVNDTGAGIPAEKQQLIFEPFAQADGSTTRKYGGTGLGLAITRHLVEIMGGEIQVKSREGKGTSMGFNADFHLPKRPYQGPAAFEPFDVKGLRVLVVDDNATTRRILEEMLTNWGMKATGVGHARVALANMEQAKRLDLPYSLVLLDAAMPGMDGFALAEEVKKRPGLVDAVIMMVTSAGQRGDAARCRELGICAYLTKPIKQSDLLDTIMAVLAHKEKHGERPPLVTRHTLRERQDTHPEKAGRPLKVLVAEDNAVNQKVVSRILEKQGHTVTLTKNGKEVVTALEDETFDLVLMDVQMPEMDGLQATRRIRERESRQSESPIPIIALTAHAMKGDRERCLEAGMDAYVSKPIRAEELFAEIEKLTDGSSGMSEGASLSSKDSEDTGVDVFNISSALEVVDGDRVLLKDLADLFVEDIPDSVKQIREGISRGEARTVELVAHRLKGSVANFGAKRAFEAAYGLELMGRQAILAGAEGAVAKLETELEQLKVAMQGVLM